jgi:hypothetical protein
VNGEILASFALGPPLAKTAGPEVTVMMRNDDVQRDTQAWIFQVWASFGLAVGMTTIGIAYVPLDAWIRAFLAMGLLFSVGSAFTLAKTVRDNHEARRLINRLSDAKTERIIRDFEVGEATGRVGS